MEGRVIGPGSTHRDIGCPVADCEIVGIAAGQGRAADRRYARLVVVFLQHIATGGIAIFGIEVPTPSDVAQGGGTGIADLQVDTRLRVAIHAGAL